MSPEIILTGLGVLLAGASVGIAAIALHVQINETRRKLEKKTKSEALQQRSSSPLASRDESSFSLEESNASQEEE